MSNFFKSFFQLLPSTGSGTIAVTELVEVTTVSYQSTVLVQILLNYYLTDASTIYYLFHRYCRHVSTNHS